MSSFATNLRTARPGAARGAGPALDLERRARSFSCSPSPSLSASRGRRRVAVVRKSGSSEVGVTEASQREAVGLSSAVVPRTKSAKKSRSTKGERASTQPLGLENHGLVGGLGRGSASPLGPSWVTSGGPSRGDGGESLLNLAVFSDVATRLLLCVFTKDGLEGDQGPVAEIELDPKKNRTGHVWHCSLRVAAGRHKDLFYTYRVAGVGSGPGAAAASGAGSSKVAEQRPGVIFNNAEEGEGGPPVRDFLLDPYAVAIASRARWGHLAPEVPRGGGDGDGRGYSSITDRFGPCWAQHACCLPSLEDFDWEGDRPLNLKMEDLVIYELHVRGFTQHPSSGVEHPGTYLGLTEKLDYLKDLGVNCVELMPVNEFNELEYYEVSPANGVYRYNVWGYSTVGFFAPMARYAACLGEGGDLGRTAEVVREFKEMVKACHQRGIEVVLDVVFNHTAEGNHQGPCLSFRGLGNRVYYMLAPQGEYYNYSGCGNTVNCNHPVTREFILDCLRYWVVEMHVDGFRFDLASILSRNHSSWIQEDHPLSSSVGSAAREARGPSGSATAPQAGGVAGAMAANPAAQELDEYVHDEDQPTGKPLGDPPLLRAISTDPILKDTKLIAEAWDCDGLNQVGSFPHYGGRWSEWNGIFRDNVRNFIKGSDGPWAGTFAGAICGSPDVYGNPEPGEGDWWGNNDGRMWRGTRGPSASVNFVTAHDGFTLADLVSYNSKHNEPNGEQNNDGEQHNNSWNCGQEGKAEEKSVIKLRHKQLRNFATALFVSQGVPMLVMGDEYGHSKGGNNNTYCHDGDINYFQWNVCERQKGLVRFFKKLIRLRKNNPSLRQSAYMDGSRIQWHGVKPGEPDWTDTSRFVAFSIKGDVESNDLYIAFNSGHSQVVAELPILESGCWDATVDTSKPAPYDFLESDDMLGEVEVMVAKEQCRAYLDDGFYPIGPYSCVILKRVLSKDESSELEDFSISSCSISKEAQRGTRTKRGAKAKRAPKKAPKRTQRASEEDKSLLKALDENRRLRAILEERQRKQDM